MFIDAATDTEQVGWRVWGGSGARVGPAGFVTSIVELCLCKLHNTYMFYILNNGLSSRTNYLEKHKSVQSRPVFLFSTEVT